MVSILPIASGKGGVGKSSLAVNLAVLLAKKEKKTVLVDLDLGGANLHTMLGLKNNHTGLGNFIYKQTDSFSSLLQDTGIPNLSFIAGDCLFPGTPNMGFFIKQRIFKELQKLDADYVLLDLGAGSAYNTLDFFLMTYDSLIVTTPEITSVLNAYSFLKAAAYRFFTGQFKTKSEERKVIQEYISGSAAGAESSFVGLVEQIKLQFPETGVKAASELEKYHPLVIMNMGETTQDLEMAKRLRTLAKNKLSIGVDFVGFVKKDGNMSLSIARRTPLALLAPESDAVKQLDAAVCRIMAHSYSSNEKLFDEGMEPDGDIGALSQEFENTKTE